MPGTKSATDILPNNNIVNLISKVKKEPEKNLVLELFQTNEKLRFRFDDVTINSLYMNGVITREKGEQNRHYVRFSCPFVQKRLFNYFSQELFRRMGPLVEPLTRLDHVITPGRLDIRELVNLYRAYLEKNRSWLFKNAPRRSDQRLFEAVFHFNLYAFIERFFQGKNGRVYPEFPTGNGKIDLLIEYNDKSYGIELKSFSDHAAYRDALLQAARYGGQLGLEEIFLVTFIESIDEPSRNTYEKEYRDASTGITVKPIFIATGTL